jgi:hypothetical protein
LPAARRWLLLLSLDLASDLGQMYALGQLLDFKNPTVQMNRARNLVMLESKTAPDLIIDFSAELIHRLNPRLLKHLQLPVQYTDQKLDSNLHLTSVNNDPFLGWRLQHLGLRRS